MPDQTAEHHRQALTQRVAPDAVRWDEETLTSHRRDTWCLSVLRAMRGKLDSQPLCVVSPQNEEQVVATLLYANEQRLPVVPFGAGSGVCGGVLPSANAVVVDMRRMNQVLDLNDKALTVRVQAGMMGGQLETALNQRGYSMRHFPQSVDISTVGGWLSTRAAGQYSTRYGCIEDIVLALEAVLADGTVVRTSPGPRSATGPDIRQIFLGSEGTLGIFTQATLRIVPLPESSASMSFSFASMSAGLEAIRQIVRAGWRPPVVRLYDKIETARLFSAASTTENCLLLLLSEGAEALVQAEEHACTAICEGAGGQSAGPEPLRHWLDERNKVPTFESLLERGLVVDTIEVATTWDHIDELYSEVIAALQQVKGIVNASGHSSHSYPQGTNIYFTFAAYPEDKEQAEATYLECWRQTMEATLRCHGTIAHHHGIGRLRVPWMRRELGAGLDVLRRLKKTLDPHGIMNPGVLIPD
jgi:alkyldihydroxyacetonephosphate synthase